MPVGTVIRKEYGEPGTWKTIAPNNSTVLDPKPRSIRCNAAGTIAIEDCQGNTTGAMNVVTGEVIRGDIYKVLATGTTLVQANILARY